MFSLRKFILISFLCAGSGITLGFLIFFSTATIQNPMSQIKKSTKVINAYHVTEILEQSFFEEAYENAYDFGDRKEARVLILPHHLVARPLIAGALKAQAKVKNPKTIVIVGPDHLHRASHSIVTSYNAWKTPYGFVDTDTDFIDQLIKEKLVVLDDDVFDVEHSVSALIPFIKRTFPQAKIVPILVQNDLAEGVRYRVADMLAQDMVMMIASVDFSHYLPSGVAYFHDIKSLRSIRNRDYTSLKNLDIDSSATLGFAYDFAEQTASENFDFYINENSDSFFGYDVPETTSYIIGGYTNSEVKKDSTVTMLAVGDMMFDRFVRTQIKKHGITYPFNGIKGRESRFFMGTDLILGNLEGAISQKRAPEKLYDFAFDTSIADVLSQFNFSAVSLANNHSLDQGYVGYEDTIQNLTEAGIGFFGHQIREDAEVWKTVISGKKIAVIGINATKNNLDMKKIEIAFTNIKKESDIVIAQVHWGNEYQIQPSNAQVSLGRAFADFGANIVIGHHPHVIEGMEIWKGAPIFWSLGNFIFDQDISFETTHGMVIGLAISENKISVRLFPVVIEKGQPRLAKDDTKNKLLDMFSERSRLQDDKLLRDLKGGKVEILDKLYE